MNWRQRVNKYYLAIICLIVSIVVLDIIGDMVLSHDAALFYRLGIGIGATVSLLSYIIMTKRVKK